MPLIGKLKVIAWAVAFFIYFLPSLGFCAVLTPLENKLLTRDRTAVHTELQRLFREEREVFDKVVDFTDPVLDVFDAFDTLKEYHLSNDSPSEKLLIERLKSALTKMPKKLPFSSDFVNAVNNVSKDFNEIIRQYNERVENAAEQRRLENENRRQALQREESDRRQKEEEQRKQVELEQKLRLEKQEQERLQSEAIAKAQEEVVLEPEYKRQALICQVCGAVQGKKDLKAGLKKYQTYEKKFGVVNLSARQQAVNMDIEYDTQISQGKHEYQSLFKKRFPTDTCMKFDSDACEEKLNVIEKHLIDKKLQKRSYSEGNGSK